MSRHHYGALASVIVGWIVCRVLAVPLVRLAGEIGGHTRAGDVAVGVAVAAVPFAVLVVYSLIRLTNRSALLRLPSVRGLLWFGWFAAGGVMGLLPYSEMGAELSLRTREAHTAPGFLHGMDMTILAGLFLVVALLLIALRARPDHTTGPVAWLEHQVEDEAEA
ncbi:MAG TPA: hypothetical protein VFN60_03870 [Acidimicrobiales bacterium]|nr:hypothetical protein [Acidimicrobiales bacterium]